MAMKHPEFRHLSEIVDSVLACHGEESLAALTSMHDLVVTPRPYPDEPPIEVIIVRSPSSGYVGAGAVLVEHRSLTGYDDQVARPSTDAVALFWQFLSYKFGIEPIANDPPISSD